MKTIIFIISMCLFLTSCEYEEIKFRETPVCEASKIDGLWSASYDTSTSSYNYHYDFAFQFSCGGVGWITRTRLRYLKTTGELIEEANDEYEIEWDLNYYTLNIWRDGVLQTTYGTGSIIQVNEDGTIQIRSWIKLMSLNDGICHLIVLHPE